MPREPATQTEPAELGNEAGGASRRSFLRALEICRQRGFKGYKTLTVLFNPDEEKSSRGSRDMIHTLSARQDYVLSYEPPDAERVIVGTNGIANLHLDVEGRASHAGSAAEKGRNAAIELSGQIMQLKDLGDPAKGTTVNWTILQSDADGPITTYRLGFFADQSSTTNPGTRTMSSMVTATRTASEA